MKIGLAVCKCEINFNDNNITTFMFTEMSIGATFHHSVFQQALCVCLQILDQFFSLCLKVITIRAWCLDDRFIVYHTDVRNMYFSGYENTNFGSNDAESE